MNILQEEGESRGEKLFGRKRESLQMSTLFKSVIVAIPCCV